MGQLGLEKSMAKQKFELTTRMTQAVELVMESDPKDWGSAEHSAMIRYLILACSDKQSFSIGEITAPDGKKVRGLVDKDGKLITECKVDMSILREEFGKTAKIFECSNFKKTLAEGDYPQFKVESKKADYL